MLGLLTKGKRRSETEHLNIVQPVNAEPIKEWYEVALCERDNEDGELAIKKIRRSIEPELTFTEDDGIVPTTEYTAIYRKVKIDDQDGLLYGAWSDTTGWQKPTVHSK